MSNLNQYDIFSFIFLLIHIIALCFAIKYHRFYKKHKDEIYLESMKVKKGNIKPEERVYKINYRWLYRCLYYLSLFMIVMVIILVAINTYITKQAIKG